VRVCLLSAALAAIVLTAGCGSTSKSTIPESKLSKIVLQKSDLPKGFSPFYLGPQVRVDQTASRSDPKRFGRTGGWINRFRRDGSLKTKGPLVVASRADLFKHPDGAKRDFRLYRDGLTAHDARRVDVGRLGAEAIGVSTLQRGTLSVRSYTIAWRQANATAELEVNGFDGELTLEDALALARKQEQRLGDAAR
jgi:hypothetical protein